MLCLSTTSPRSLVISVIYLRVPDLLLLTSSISSLIDVIVVEWFIFISPLLPTITSLFFLCYLLLLYLLIVECILCNSLFCSRIWLSSQCHKRTVLSCSFHLLWYFRTLILMGRWTIPVLTHDIDSEFWLTDARSWLVNRCHVSNKIRFTQRFTKYL